jgi:hypothetical protein
VTKDNGGVTYVDTTSASIINFKGEKRQRPNTIEADGRIFIIGFQNCDLIIDDAHRITIGSSPITKLLTRSKERLIVTVCIDKTVRTFYFVSVSQVIIQWRFRNPIERPHRVGIEFGGYAEEYLLLFASSKNHTNVHLTEADTGTLIKTLTCAHGPCTGIAVHNHLVYL